MISGVGTTGNIPNRSVSGGAEISFTKAICGTQVAVSEGASFAIVVQSFDLTAV
jgi:hypothetical protein